MCHVNKTVRSRDTPSCKSLGVSQGAQHVASHPSAGSKHARLDDAELQSSSRPLCTESQHPGPSTGTSEGRRLDLCTRNARNQQAQYTLMKATQRIGTRLLQRSTIQTNTLLRNISQRTSD